MPLRGQFCFAVSADVWQAVFIKNAILDLAGHAVGVDGTLKRMQKLGLLKEPFGIRRDWNPELVDVVRRRVPDFASPCQAIQAYGNLLVAKGIFRGLSAGGWCAPYEAGPAARRTMEAAKHVRGRAAQLAGKLAPIADALGRDGPVIVRAWMSRTLADTDASPDELLMQGGPSWEALIEGLASLAAMLVPNGSSLAPKHLLGFPLEQHRRAREEESEARCREIEQSRRQRIRCKADEFLVAIALRAEASLGIERGRAFVRQAIGDPSPAEREDGRFGKRAPTRERIEADLWREESRLAEAHDAEIRRREAERQAVAEAEVRRMELRREANRAFSGDPDREERWLHGKQPSLGMSPWQFCVDGATLRQCKALLNASLLRGRRRA